MVVGLGCAGQEGRDERFGIRKVNGVEAEPAESLRGRRKLV